MSTRLTERPHRVGAWVAAPLPGEEEAPPEGAVAEGGGDDEDDGAVDERQLAKDDPAAGLLHMQVGCNIWHSYAVRVGCAGTARSRIVRARV